MCEMLVTNFSDDVQRWNVIRYFRSTFSPLGIVSLLIYNFMGDLYIFAFDKFSGMWLCR